MATLQTQNLAVRLRDESNLLEIGIQGKLEKTDYEILGPHVEQLLKEHGSLRMLVILEDFHGWSAGALWEEVKFAAEHFSDIDRLAILGETKWEKGMAAFCKPFTRAEVKYFPKEQEEEARAWIVSP